ncbi:hypothetical protein FQR65_LT19794 [Abscondita terminalis]|nr:hypothetical protein FQR65_LT19794 [Abscondita terminalis]
MLFHLPKVPAEIRISHLNARINEQRKRIAQSTASKLELLQLTQQLVKEARVRKKHNQKIYVLDFKGDVQASAVENLREEITLILATAKAGRDRVIVRLESPGGMVHGYGLAAAQLVRLRDAGFHLTICVDKVAASGGYMMACIASEIVSAPFAVVGSIGVVAQVPNFNRLLKEHHVDFELYTAGQFKRTVTMFGENTPEGKAKFEEELQQTHQLFKHFVEKYRPQLNVEKVATGEHWYGEDARDLNLVDKLQTSDEYLLSLLPQHDVYVIQTRRKPTLGEKLGLQAAQMADALIPSLVGKLFNEVERNINMLAYDADLELFRDNFKRFMAEHVAPFYEQWEKEGLMPRSVWSLLGENGYLCVDVPEATYMAYMQQISSYWHQKQKSTRPSAKSWHVIVDTHIGMIYVFKKGTNLDKIGLHLQDYSEYSLDNLKSLLPRLWAMLVKPCYLMQELPRERTAIAATALGAIRGAIDVTTQYVQERQAFGQKIGSFQNTRFVLAQAKIDELATAAFYNQNLALYKENKLDVKLRRL